MRLRRRSATDSVPGEPAGPFQADVSEARAAASHAPALILVGAFLLVGLASLDDYGITWDEGEKIHADASYLEILGRTRNEDPRVIHLPGYFYVFDTARSVYAKGVADLLGCEAPVQIHHSFNLLVATASLLLMYALVLRVAGCGRLALFATGALALAPRFVAHSQNNPKDLPALFLFLLFALVVVRLASSSQSLPATLAAAAVFGVSLTTRVSSLLLPVILGPWLLLRWPERARARTRTWALICTGGVVFAVIFWPALWSDPWAILAGVPGDLGRLRDIAFPVLYLGEVEPWTSLPWHFLPLHLIVSLPLSFIALLLLSPLAAARVRAEAGRRRADLWWLAFLWTAVVLAAEQLSPLRYDGIRHFLPILPAVAILVACGADVAGRVLALLARGRSSSRARARAVLGWAPAALCGALAGMQLFAVHPYASAYVNPIAGVLGGGRTEEWLEVEYWGSPYKEGAEWINLHAEPDAEVFLPIGGGHRSGEDIARYYLERPLAREHSLARFEDPSRPRYLIFITRVAWYDELVRAVREYYEPVFQIKRQRATLLEIYRNRAQVRAG